MKYNGPKSCVRLFSRVPPAIPLPALEELDHFIVLVRVPFDRIRQGLLSAVFFLSRITLGFISLRVDLAR